MGLSKWMLLSLMFYYLSVLNLAFCLDAQFTAFFLLVVLIFMIF